MPFISSRNRQVAMGPVMAEAKVGGIQIRGLRTMLPIWSMEVPSPWDDQPFRPVLPEGQHRKAHHLGTAAGHCGAAGQTGQPQRRADCRAGDGQGQGNPHDHRDQNSHEEGLQLRGPHNKVPHPGSRGANGRRHQISHPDPHQNRHNGGHQDIHLGLLGDRLAAFRRDDGDDQHRQTARQPLPGYWWHSPPAPGRKAPAPAPAGPSRWPPP